MQLERSRGKVHRLIEFAGKHRIGPCGGRQGGWVIRIGDNRPPGQSASFGEGCFAIGLPAV